MLQEKTPSISVVIPTYNSEKTLSACLSSIKSQKYNAKKVEVIIVDGGSSDATLKIAKGFSSKIINVPPSKQNAEYNKYLGFSKSKGDLVLMLDSDNILTHKNWLKRMVEPFKKENNLVGSDTVFIRYKKSLSAIDRYLALFGSLDPVAFYLGKSDKMPRFDKRYSFFKNAEDKEEYYLVKLGLNLLPAIGSNGFLMNRRIILENARTDKNHFFHTDIHFDVIKRGFDSYAFVKTDISHLTGVRSIRKFIVRRVQFMEYNLSRAKYRRHSVYMPQDKFNLFIYIIYSITFIKPLYDSFRGYLRIRDFAWFLHPVLCIVFLIIYGFVVMKTAVKKIF